jgi:hypothetical protein
MKLTYTDEHGNRRTIRTADLVIAEVEDREGNTTRATIKHDAKNYGNCLKVGVHRTDRGTQQLLTAETNRDRTYATIEVENW